MEMDQAVSSSVKRIPFYFGSGDDAMIAWLHLPASSTVSTTGIVLCPPLAVEYMSTYRSYRYIADYYAQAGIPALRFDYHGTGDAAGYIEDSDRIQTWVGNILQATEHLKRLTACTDVGLFGFRMGANLATLASEKIDLAFLIIWAAFPRGRNFVRENRAVQMTSAVKTDNLEVDYLDAGGMVYWQQTVDDISQIDLAKMRPKANRVLVIPRDDFTPDTKLLENWKSAGINAEQQALAGSANMILNAFYAVVPHDSIKQMVAWTKHSLPNTNIELPASLDFNLTTNVEFKHYNGCKGEHKDSAITVKESIYWYGKDKTGFTILTEPSSKINEDLPVIIIANSGSTHRVGPSRLYVLLAREFARMGLRTLRIDVPGLGDSYVSDTNEENIEYILNSNEVLGDVMQSFERTYGKQKFVLMGLCSGAYFSFLAAVKLKSCNIIESLLINPLTFYWEEGMTVDNSPTQSYSHWSWYKQALRDPKSWKKLFSGRADIRFLFKTVLKRIRIKIASKARKIHKPVSGCAKKESKSMSLSKDLDSNLLQIKQNGRHLSFVLSRQDPGYDILMTKAGKTAKKLQKKGNISISFVEKADHTFSKYKPRCDAIQTIVSHIRKRYL